MPRGDAGRRRCAIYTRKSSEEGLEQEFNSLAAQREACEAYIRSQQHEGWALARPRYDDGGFKVLVLDDGFSWQSTYYGSLSAVATKITGTPWSGPLFFGLKQNRPAARRSSQLHPAEAMDRFGLATP